MRHIPAAGADAVAAVFAERLYNADGGNPDALFIGGGPDDHTTEAITAAWKHLHMCIRQAAPLASSAWSALLRRYRAVIYTDSTEVRMLACADHNDQERITFALMTVAERYGLRLPCA